MRAMPAAYQNTAVASSATATNAPPMPAPRAPTPSLRNCPPNVPTFSKMAACASPGSSNATSPVSAISLFTMDPPYVRRSADDDELAALGALARIHGEQVDAARDILPIARDQVPARLTIIRRVLLPIHILVRNPVAVDDRGVARGGVHRIVGI